MLPTRKQKPNSTEPIVPVVPMITGKRRLRRGGWQSRMQCGTTGLGERAAMQRPSYANGNGDHGRSWRRIWIPFLLLAVLPATLPAQSQQVDPSMELQNSVSRLQTFEKGNMRDLRRDPERDRDIEQMLPHYRVTTSGSSDSALRDEALQRLNRLTFTASGRQTANQVVDNLSLYRRLPEVRFEVDPDTYDYFVGNPDSVVALWQALGISAINLREVKQYHYQMNNPDGTVSDVYYLRRTKNENVIYCDGEFKSPFLAKPIAAKGILCLYTTFEEEDGVTFARHHADALISFPSTAVETAARLISPVSNYIADRNFQEISLFMHTMSLTMSRQPGWVQQQIARMKAIRPTKAEELMQVTLQNYEAHQNRLAARWRDLTDPPM